MIRCKQMAVLILLGLLLGFPQGALGQRPPPHRGDMPDSPEERERIRENIETLRMYKLLEALDLSSEQSMQFLPALKDFQDAKTSFEEKRRERLLELEVALESKENNEKKLKEALESLENARKEFHMQLENFLEESKTILTLEQRARLHIFEEKFERRLKETIRRMRGKGLHWKE